MSDLLIRRAQPDAAALIEAVAHRDDAAVAEVLTTLGREQLYALAIVLARYAGPDPTETDETHVLDQAVRRAAHMFSIDASAVCSSNRRREAIDARGVASYAGYLLGISYSAIGRHIGRDHTTVMAAVSRVGENPRLRRAAQEIARELGWNRDVELPLGDVGA